VGLSVWVVAAASAGTPEIEPRYRLLAVFLSTIVGLMLAPISGGAVVLLGVLATALTEALPFKVALSGYAHDGVWLVLAAFLMSRAFIKTGLARRVALSFVWLLGRTTLGLSYALVATDVLLAGLIPSNGARVGGIMLPIARSLASLYNSEPGPSAGRLGLFLMLVLYQADVMACALFITGQTGNLFAGELATKELAQHGHTIAVTYLNWLYHASVPACVCLLLIPWVIYRWWTPEVRATPDARAFAERELTTLGQMSRDETLLTGLFAVVVMTWAGLPRIPPGLTALAGVGVLLVTNILTWDDVTGEKAAWDVFVWYGGLVMLGEQLSHTGLTKDFAGGVAGSLGGLSWFPLFLLLVLVYFFAHYGFAGITTHLLSMYPAFVGVLIVAGAPPLLAAWSLAFIANFSAGLTHYGTTHAPLVFGTGYVPVGVWWRVGLGIAGLNLLVWLTLGLAWWRVTGLW
jgi:DASS family divalent anion:Na+ symporter